MSNTRDMIKEMCESKCEIIPIPQKIPEKIDYANYTKRTTYKRVYEGKPYDLVLVSAELDTLVITFTPVGAPRYYEVYLRQLPTYTSLPVHTTGSNTVTLAGLSVNTVYEVDVVAYYITGNAYHIKVKKLFSTINESPPANIFVAIPTQLTNYTGNLFFNVSFADASGNPLYYIFNYTTESGATTTQILYKGDTVLIPDVVPNETYTFDLTSIYYEAENNPDYKLTKTVQMTNESTVASITIDSIEGHQATVSFADPLGDLSDISFVVLLDDVFVVDLSSTSTSVLLDNLNHNQSYNVKVLTYYFQSQNEYLLETTFQTLNETQVTDFVVDTIERFNAKINYTVSPEFTASDAYLLTLLDVSGVTVAGPTSVAGNVTLPIDISNVFAGGLAVDSSYQFIVESVYNATGHSYTNNVEFKTLNEGIIESCVVTEFTGASVGIQITPFGDSTPIRYDVTLHPYQLVFTTLTKTNTTSYGIDVYKYGDEKYDNSRFHWVLYYNNFLSDPNGDFLTDPTYTGFKTNQIYHTKYHNRVRVLDYWINQTDRNGTSPTDRIMYFYSTNTADDFYPTTFSTTETTYFLDNQLVKDQLYGIFVTAVYESGNTYTSLYADVSFQTRDEEALDSNTITLDPYGSYVIATINYSSASVGDISTNFDYEIRSSNNISLFTGSGTAVNSEITLNTLTDHDDALDAATSYLFVLISKYGDAGETTRLYYTSVEFTTLEEYPLVLNTSTNFSLSAHTITIDINNTPDILLDDGHVIYTLTLSDNQEISGNKTIFPVTFSDLSKNTDYVVTVVSEFATTTSHIYDVSYNITTLLESGISKIEFENPDSTAYNPYSSVLVSTQYVNPGAQHAVVTLYPPDESPTNLQIAVIQESNQNTIATFSYTNPVFSGTPDPVLRQSISGLVKNTLYILQTTTTYSTGNSYVVDMSFQTLNESAINTDQGSGFYLYTTNNTIAVDFVETGDSLTGTDLSYVLFLSYIEGDNDIDVSFSQVDPPLDFSVNIVGKPSIASYLQTHYANGNVYKSNTVEFNFGFTSEDYVQNGSFSVGIDTTSFSSRGISTVLPTNWTTSTNVVISKNASEDSAIFYKQNDALANSQYCAIIYLPSNVSNPKILRQPVAIIRGANSVPDNNLYAGTYQVTFYAAMHKEGGEVYTFGNVFEGSIEYMVRLYNTSDPETTIVSQTFTTTSTTYEYKEITFVVPTSYSNAEFQIMRTKFEKNNLYIMDVTMKSIESSSS